MKKKGLDVIQLAAVTDPQSNDDIHEPCLTSKPRSASWQPYQLSLNIKLKCHLSVLPLLGTEPTWKNLIWPNVFQFPLSYWCWPLYQQPQNAKWVSLWMRDAVRKIWVCFLFCGSAPQTYLKPTAQAKNTVKKDILEDTGSVFVYVCIWASTHTLSHVAVVKRNNDCNL